MADRITYSNMFSGPRANILALIDDKSNVADPVTSISEYRKWIYSRDPDIKSNNFTGFPILIIHSSEFETEEQGSCDMKSKPVNWSIEIEILTCDRGYGTKDGEGMTHMDAISDDIATTLLNATNRKTLQSNNLFDMSFTSSRVTPEVMGEQLVYRRSFNVELNTRLKVSA